MESSVIATLGCIVKISTAKGDDIISTSPHDRRKPRGSTLDYHTPFTLQRRGGLSISGRFMMYHL